MGPGQRVGIFGMGGFRTFLKDSSVLEYQLPKGTIRKVIGFAKPYYLILTAYVIVIVADALISVANPLIYREILNRGIIGHNRNLIILLAVSIAVLAVFDAMLNLLMRLFSAKIGEGLIYDMRSKVFEHIQKMPIAFFMRAQTGALVSRLNNDIIGAQQAFTQILSGVFGNLVLVAFSVVAMAFLSLPITVGALFLLPAFILPARRIGRRLQKLTQSSYNLNAQMNNMMNERFNVAGALLVKIFGDPKKETSEFNKRARAVRDIGVSTAMYGRIFFVALSLVSSVATALVYGWGGILALNKETSVGSIVALAVLLTRLYSPLTSLSNMNVDIMTALVSFDRIFEILRLKPMVAEKENPINLSASQISIEFEHVSFKYPDASQVSLASLESVNVLEKTVSKEVLHDISFKVKAGQICALVGPSGAGKTTISYLVARLFDPTKGTIRFNSIDVKDLSFESIRKIVGMVTQDAHLFHDTIRANLLFAKRDATDEELYSALSDAQILDLIETLPDGLDTVVGDRGYRLSGGEKQRISIARLLLKEPNVVVLDEATAHLDSESELKIQKAFDKALANRTSIVIAHRLSTVRNADLIIVVDQGRVVERGTHEELLAANGLYSELYSTQFKSQSVLANESKS